MGKNIFIIMAAAILATGCLDQEIQYYPSAHQDLSDKPAAITLHAERSADNVVKVVLRKGDGFTTCGLYADATHPATEEQIVQINVGDEEAVAAYSRKTGVDYKPLPEPFYKFFESQALALHKGSVSTAVTQLRLLAVNPLDNVLEAGRYLLPLSVSSLWNDSSTGNVYIDVTVRETYSDPDGYELYKGDDMLTVFYPNTAVFDPRLANDFILENIRDKNYHRGLGNIVNLRQASLYYDNKLGKVSMKLNNDLRYVLEHFTERVLPVQESGRKVCVCIDGEAQGIGFCNLTDEQIEDFAKSVKKIVERYGLDGINLWDRNANYAVAEEKGFPKVNTTSYPRLIKALREALGQNKLLTVTDYEEPTEYFWDTEATGGIKVGETVSVDYSLIAAENAIVKVLPENGYTVSVNPTSGTQGTLGITSPSPVVNAAILVVAVNGNGVMSGKILTVTEGELEVKADATPVSADGGSVTVQITTNLDYEIVIPETAKSWVTLVQTKALRTDNVTFSVAPNTETSQRTAEIEARVDGVKVQTFNIVQQAKAADEKWNSVDFGSLYDKKNPNHNSESPSQARNLVTSDGWKTNNIVLYDASLFPDYTATVGLSG